MKYTIQFGAASYLRDLLKDDLNNIPYLFKFDETKAQQAKKPYNGYTHCIKISYHCTLMVDHCFAEQLLDHFFKFIIKANLDLHIVDLCYTLEWIV